MIWLVTQAGIYEPEEQGPAHIFLAHYHMKAKHFSEAEVHAHKAMEFVSVSIGFSYCVLL